MQLSGGIKNNKKVGAIQKQTNESTNLHILITK